MSYEHLSEVIEKRIDLALQEAVAERGGMLIGSVTVVSYIDTDGALCWSFVTAPEQRVFLTLGLLRFATLQTEQQVTGA